MNSSITITRLLSVRPSPAEAGYGPRRQAITLALVVCGLLMVRRRRITA